MTTVSADGARWFSRPEGDHHLLRRVPQLECWNKTNDPAQVRLQEYLADTEALLASSRVDGPWALRLDVGLPAERGLLDTGDLDNYLHPLARRLADYRLREKGLVSAWCTKQHGAQSLVRIEPARPASAPETDLLVAHTTPPAANYKRQVRSAVVQSAELPGEAVRLELSFIVGPSRNWLNLWKPTIDALDPLLGRTRPDRDWHPLDGRITELGLHLRVDPAARYDVTIAIAASSTAHATRDANAVSKGRKT